MTQAKTRQAALQNGDIAAAEYPVPDFLSLAFYGYKRSAAYGKRVLGPLCEALGELLARGVGHGTDIAIARSSVVHSTR